MASIFSFLSTVPSTGPGTKGHFRESLLFDGNVSDFIWSRILESHKGKLERGDGKRAQERWLRMILLWDVEQGHKLYRCAGSHVTTSF